jgi:DNA-binding GntR family transcriptional regulator
MPAGQPLREAFWAGQLGVSRTAVREALVRLAVEGLVQRGPVTGYVIPEPDKEDMADLLELRIMLESGAINLIVSRHLLSTEDINALNESCDLLDRFGAQDYAASAVEVDDRFHQRLIDAGQNRRLRSLYRQTPRWDCAKPVATPSEWRTIATHIASDHRAIVHALQANDAPRAAALLEDHLRHRSALPLPLEA